MKPIHRFLFLFIAVIPAVIALVVLRGSMPPSVTSLDAIISKELGLENSRVYGYRCTVGAHRGASVEHTENTLDALRTAQENDRYAFIEFDVQYSEDDRITVFHDRMLLRLFGSLRAIGSTTFAELEEVTGGEIAGYDEVMDMVTKKINLEIKSQGDPEEDRRLADEIIADLQKRNRVKDVMISSISGEVIRYIKDRYPTMATGQVYWLTSSTYLHLESLTRSLYTEFSDSRADYLLLHVANLRNIDDLLLLKPEDKTIMFWDFDDAIYLVHKDTTDRLWGDSILKAFIQDAGYRILTRFFPGKGRRE